MLQKAVDEVAATSTRTKNHYLIFVDICLLDSVVTIGPWGPWSDCSATCGFGVMIRTRACAPNGFCNGFLSETRECSTGCRAYTCSCKYYLMYFDSPPR